MSAFDSPLVRYGITVPTAAIVVAIGVLVFEGPARLLAFAIAAVEVLVVPQILKRVE